jgi:glycosyltransferase involved in cell wall biosynthesis
MTTPELSIVIPFPNEAEVLPLLRERLTAIKNSAPNWELIFVSDRSTNNSIGFVETWASEMPFGTSLLAWGRPRNEPHE